MRADLRRLVVLAVVLAAWTGPALAEAPQGAAVGEDDTYQPVTVLGLQMFIDRETGQLRQPTPEESAELSAAMAQLFAGLEAPAGLQGAELREDGSHAIELGLGALDFSVARVAADGSLVFDCAEHAEEAAELIATPIAAPEER